MSLRIAMRAPKARVCLRRFASGFAASIHSGVFAYMRYVQTSRVLTYYICFDSVLQLGANFLLLFSENLND